MKRIFYIIKLKKRREMEIIKWRNIFESNIIISVENQSMSQSILSYLFDSNEIHLMKIIEQ